MGSVPPFSITCLVIGGGGPPKGLAVGTNQAWAGEMTLMFQDLLEVATTENGHVAVILFEDSAMIVVTNLAECKIGLFIFNSGKYPQWLLGHGFRFRFFDRMK